MVGNREGEERVGMEQRERIKKDGKGMARGTKSKETEGGERVWKGELRLDLDICPKAPEFLVTPLPQTFDHGQCLFFKGESALYIP